MIEVISVRFKNKGKVYFFDPSDLTIPTGANVVVETAKGLEYAECTYGNHAVEETSIIQPLRPVVRLATQDDDKHAAANKDKEADAFSFCQKKIAEHGLDMKLVDVEFSFEGNKILFFFTSDGRVDFRELVKDLASVFKTRIELRQIGVRDEARMIGGLGICGKEFCCSQFMEEFHPVSIKMAKTQGLSLNPVKISGTCGRLMCCLKYEEPAYQELVKKAPKVDAFVDTPSGKGSVTGINLLRGQAKVRLEDGGDTTLKTFPFDELSVLGGKARRAEYIAARDEGRLKEAGFTDTRQHAPKLETKPLQTSDRSDAPKSRGDKPSGGGQRRGGDGQRNQSRRNKGGKQQPRKADAPAEQKKTQPQAGKQPNAAPSGGKPQGGKPQGTKPSKRSHRGGRGRNKSRGPKPAGSPPADASPKP